MALNTIPDLVLSLLRDPNPTFQLSQSIETYLAQLYNARARSYIGLGRMEDALSEIQEIIRLLPDSYLVRSDPSALPHSLSVL